MHTYNYAFGLVSIIYKLGSLKRGEVFITSPLQRVEKAKL